jgi:hypothetical protein
VGNNAFNSLIAEFGIIGFIFSYLFVEFAFSGYTTVGLGMQEKRATLFFAVAELLPRVMGLSSRLRVTTLADPMC